MAYFPINLLPSKAKAAGLTRPGSVSFAFRCPPVFPCVCGTERRSLYQLVWVRVPGSLPVCVRDHREHFGEPRGKLPKNPWIHHGNTTGGVGALQ